MNKDILQGKWDQLKGTIQKKWGELTNDDVNEIEGNYKILSGKLQEKYGYSQDKADEDVNNWLDNNNR